MSNQQAINLPIDFAKPDNQEVNQMYIFLKSFSIEFLQNYFKIDSIEEFSEAIEEIGCYLNKSSEDNYFVCSYTVEGLERFVNMSDLDGAMALTSQVYNQDIKEESVIVQ